MSTTAFFLLVLQQMFQAFIAGDTLQLILDNLLHRKPSAKKEWMVTKSPASLHDLLKVRNAAGAETKQTRCYDISSGKVPASHKYGNP